MAIVVYEYTGKLPPGEIIDGAREFMETDDAQVEWVEIPPAPGFEDNSDAPV